jgi:DNA-binding IclR family transcriptional regulator
MWPSRPLCDHPITIDYRSAVSDNQSIGRALALLRAVSRSPGDATVTALAADTGLTRTTASRLLGTLESHGLLDRDPGTDRYVLGFELARLGRLADPDRSLVLRAGPVMEALAATTGESITLSVPTEDGEVAFVHQVNGPRLIGGRLWVGERFPLHASSSGKLLLAEVARDDLAAALPAELPRVAPATITARAALLDELDRVRAQGHALTVEELEEGLVGMSVPVRGGRGELLAMLSVSGPAYRLGLGAREAVLATLVDAGEALRARLVGSAQSEGSTG